MKKIMALAVLTMVIGVPQAMAQGGPGGSGKGSMGKDRAPRHERMFEQHDANGDGVISKEEFMARHEEMFSKLDADSNGEISKEESDAARNEMRERMRERREKRREKGMQGEAGSK